MADTPIKRCVIDRAELRYGTARGAQLASRAVDRLFEVSGGHALFLDHPLQRRYQDIKGMMAHAALGAQLPAKIFGATLLGLPVRDLFI